MAKNPAYPRLPPVDKTALLRRILARCARKPGDVTPVVVFDLDGTLMDNRPRTLAILRDLAHVWKPIHKEPAARLEQASLADLSYLLTDSLARMEITRSDLVAEAEAFWRERFFGDDALAHDVALDGAVEFARACYDAGAILVYLTGRDLPSMGIGANDLERNGLWLRPIGTARPLLENLVLNYGPSLSLRTEALINLSEIDFALDTDRGRPVPERIDNLLAHLFQHQIHHRTFDTGERWSDLNEAAEHYKGAPAGGIEGHSGRLPTCSESCSECATEAHF